MIYNLYSVFDQKTRAFEQPFLAENDETAKRTFKRIIESVPMIKQHPADYDLFSVGSFDNSSAKINAQEIVQKIDNGLSLDNYVPTDDYNETSKKRNESPILASTESGNPTF
nr:MAG: nonstructural protein [Microvirus sp.]